MIIGIFVKENNMQKILEDLKELFRDRKALLWVCQRYDLKDRGAVREDRYIDE